MTSHALMPYALATLACLFSAAGGFLTLRFHRRLGLVFAMCAGVLIGVALSDMLPETLKLLPRGSGPAVIAAALAGGIGLIGLDAGLPKLSQSRGLMRLLGPASLSLHSFIDGLGIGLGFKLSSSLGWTVAAGVLAHDLADGVNVVSVGLAVGSRVAARRWMLANSVAPILGVAAAQLLTISAIGLAWVVAVLIGVFLALAGRELLPKSARLIGAGRAGLGLVVGVGLVFAWTFAEG